MQAFRAATLLKKRFEYRNFPVDIAKISRTSILENICNSLLLTFLSLHEIVEPIRVQILKTGSEKTDLSIKTKNFLKSCRKDCKTSEAAVHTCS